MPRCSGREDIILFLPSSFKENLYSRRNSYHSFEDNYLYCGKIFLKYFNDCGKLTVIRNIPVIILISFLST